MAEAKPTTDADLFAAIISALQQIREDLTFVIREVYSIRTGDHQAPQRRPRFEVLNGGAPNDNP